MVIGSGVAYPIIHTTSELGLEAARLGHNTGIEFHLVCWSNMPPLTMSDTRVAQYIGVALVRGKVVWYRCWGPYHSRRGVRKAAECSWQQGIRCCRYGGSVWVCIE